MMLTALYPSFSSTSSVDLLALIHDFFFEQKVLIFFFISP